MTVERFAGGVGELEEHPFPTEAEIEAYRHSIKYRKARKKRYGRHPYWLTDQEWLFFREFIKTAFDPGKAVRAAYTSKSWNPGRNYAIMAQDILEKPVMRYAIKREIQKMNKDIDEGYLTNALLELEANAKDSSDRTALVNVYKAMMKLKGLGKTVVQNENIQKSEFELMTGEKLQEKLVEAVTVLIDSGNLDLNKFIIQLKEYKVEEIESNSEVKVIDESTREIITGDGDTEVCE